MCRFCNLTNGDLSNEPFIHEQIDVLQGKAAMTFDMWVKNDKDLTHELLFDISVGSIDCIIASRQIHFCPMCGRDLWKAV